MHWAVQVKMQMSCTYSLDFAFLLGALHALEPGHGKTAMAAFMLGGRKNAWHASWEGDCLSSFAHLRARYFGSIRPRAPLNAGKS